MPQFFHQPDTAVNEDVPIVMGTGNVFADLELPHPKEHQAKAAIVFAINEAIRASRLSQTEAAALVGMRQPNLSRILSGNFSSVTFDRLFEILGALGGGVQLSVHSRAPRGMTSGITLGVVFPLCQDTIRFGKWGRA